MRKVRRPDELVDAHQVAQPHAHAVLLKTPEDMLLEIVRGLLGQWLPTQDLLSPVPVPLVADIGHLIGPREPADLGLGKEQLQAWEALEHPVQRHLHGVEKAQAAESSDLRRQVRQWAQPAGPVVELSRVAQQRAAARAL